MRTLNHPAQIYYSQIRHFFIEVLAREQFFGTCESLNRLAGLWKVEVPAEADDVDAGWTALGAFHTVFEIDNPCAVDIFVYDESMEPIELD